MPRCHIMVLNGPNLGHLGVRQPEIYGLEGMERLPELLAALSPQAAEEIDFDYYQANSEGGVIDLLELAWKEKMDGVVLNAGAYTHTSLALADCLAWIKLPVVEVHLSNVFARAEAEPIRGVSFMAKHCLGVIAGFGLSSYALAALLLWQRAREPRA